MSVLSSELRRELERAVVAGRVVAEDGVRAAFSLLGVFEDRKPSHLDEDQARLRRGLRAKQRQLGGEPELLMWDAAYEQWHRLLFARFLAERGLLRHPQFDAPVTLSDCDELAGELGEPDGWSVAGRFASEILPGIFRLEDPCVQLRLAPEHRQRLTQIVTGLPDVVFATDDALGWVYQYWQSERKNEVNASEAKIGGADLGPVTQLFTENYMVRFLLENSLGAWWAGGHPNSPLLDGWEFLRFDAETGIPAAGTFEEWPKTVAEVTVMDPCCGSGHFLVEAFKMLWRMRVEEEGLNPVAAQDAVLADNLFGLELDPRCVQIAMFAVALQAWTDGNGWRQLPVPNIACSGTAAKAPLKEWTALAADRPQLAGALERLHGLFKEADTLGSLIDPRRAAEGDSAQLSIDSVNFADVAPHLERVAEAEVGDPAAAVLGADAAGVARAAHLLGRSYSLTATNVPYLKRSRQSSVLADYCLANHESAKQDLALCVFERALDRSDAVASVLPHGWLFMSWTKNFREESLEKRDWRTVAHLGTGAFRAISGEVVNVLLGVFGGQHVDDSFYALRADHVRGVDDTAMALRRENLTALSQAKQLTNPDSKVILEKIPDWPLLEEYAGGFAGICSGDYPRFGRYHWELPLPSEGWSYQQSTVSETTPFAGRDHVFYWQGGEGDFVEFVTERLGEGNEGAWIRGTDFAGRWGVAVSSMSSLPVTLYTGELFDNNTAVIMPDDRELLPAIWAFAKSPEFERSVRRIDTSIKVTNATFVKIPFDVERWRAAARDEFPDGLPKPWSDDPTQWLFEGDPAVAREPLQAAVARLVGYQWPEQPDDDRLDVHADEDGIACLPPVAQEQPAGDRLHDLLADAFGDDWGSGSVRELLEQAGSKKKTLADWLEKDFFKHHCSVFSNRPFVWHITDNQAGGFSALVNYHKLGRAGLEKLTYTYLGDWIERQTADAADGVAGADSRLAAAKELKEKLELILEGEPPYDVYVRWKELHEQPIGWDPDLNDGVRLNIRPFLTADVLAGSKSVPRIHWKKDRGKNPDGSKRINDLHFTNDEKRKAREEAGAG